MYIINDNEKYSIYEGLAIETERRITYYREKKNDNMFDDFYHSHLDFMETCVDEWLENNKPIDYVKPQKKQVERGLRAKMRIFRRFIWGF